MASQGESLIKKTQKGLYILAFETTKQSRILKKRMRIAALQKEIKADLRDLGNLVYNAIVNDQPGILEEEEVKILVENVGENKKEVEHLRDAIARLSRTRKHFEEEDWESEGEEGLAGPDEPPGVVVEPHAREAVPPGGTEVSTEREMKEAVLEPAPPPTPPKQARKPAEAKKTAAVKEVEEETPAAPAPGAEPQAAETEPKETTGD
jgi:hypothetical protein